VYEWNGTMIHAKTAVADGRWARIGSTNLNITSWIGNWELDVAIEDAGVAGELGDRYEQDLTGATEIVPALIHAPFHPLRPARWPPVTSRPAGASRRSARTLAGVGRSLGAAVTGNRPLEDFEIVPVVGAGVLLVVIAGLSLYAPRLVAWTLAAFALWLAASLFADAWSLRRRR
jgi:cardiolipin synthase